MPDETPVNRIIQLEGGVWVDSAEVAMMRLKRAVSYVSAVAEWQIVLRSGHIIDAVESYDVAVNGIPELLRAFRARQ